MGVRVGELDPGQQARLRAALGETLAAHFAYPPFYSFRADRPLTRPLDRAKRAELAAYVATIGLAPLERMEVDSPELRRYFEGVFLRYLDVNPQLASARAARHRPRLRAEARTIAGELQRELVAFLRGAAPAFGAPRPPASWTDAFTPAQRAAPTSPDRDTAALEAILARAQASPADRRRGAAASPPRAASPAPEAFGNPADDRQVFAQLRGQLEAYIRRAVESYGLPDRGGDPARALDDLRTSGLVDETNLRVAESILALTDRVLAQGDASVDEYRQALTLYLLYHRSHLRP